MIASESRPLAVTHALAVGIGAGWLALVYLTPAPPPTIALLRPEEMAAIEVQFDDPPPPKQEAPPPEEASAINKPSPTPAEKERERAQKEEAEIGDAFGGGTTNALVGDVTNALRGVEVAKGDQAGAGGRKAVIGYGQGGVGARTPGKGFDAAAAAAASGIGKVNATGGVARANIRVAAPQVVARPGERASRDMAQLGTFVRSRQAQLQFCYQELGLLINPALAGSISVEVTLAPGGAVAAARVVNRTWTGAGVNEAEGCILSRIRSWGFPSSSAAGNETYGFSFVFNK
jgi:hypothetical protein